MYNSAEDRHALFERQGGRCTGCLRQFPYRNLTVDHVLPQSKGGGDAIGNLQLLCGACNSKKGAGTHEELIARLAAEGVIRATASLFGRKGYAPAKEGTMGPVAAAAVTIALPYVMAGVTRTMQIAYENRAEIKEETVKRARALKGVKALLRDVRGLPLLLPSPRRGGRDAALEEERLEVLRWWWWTAGGGLDAAPRGEALP